MRIFSGIKPTGPLHVGSYAGAISQWLAFQKDPASEGFFCVVDLHALTNNPSPEQLRRDIMETAAGYLAFGLHDARFPIFIQSHVPAHSELTWVLSTLAGVGELERMTQFKDKAGYAEILKARDRVTQRLEQTIEELDLLQAGSMGAHHRLVRDQHKEVIDGYRSLKEELDNLHALLTARDYRVGAGLLNYPVFMAADILLYDTDVVPVGEDQLQHVELARTLARRFNSRYGETFKLPRAKLVKGASRIMSLQDPKKKMSKSLGSAHYVGIFEPADIVRKKIMSAVTDSGSDIKYDPATKPALSNLITLMGVVTGKSASNIEHEYAHVGYAAFKEKLAEAFLAFFESVRRKKAELDKDPHHVLFELKAGAEKAREITNKKLRDAQYKIGLV